jgi:hypothetical protein
VWVNEEVSAALISRYLFSFRDGEVECNIKIGSGGLIISGAGIYWDGHHEGTLEVLMNAYQKIYISHGVKKAIQVHSSDNKTDSMNEQGFPNSTKRD